MDVDSRLLAGITTALRDGLRVVELHEADAARHAGAQLQAALLAPVALLADHARRVNDAVRRENR